MTKDLDGLSILVILFLKQMPPMFLKTKPQCSSKVKKNCYLLMVRPILEYASVVWSPHTQCDIYIYKIEMVQCHTARFTFKNFSCTASVTKMLASLLTTHN